MGPGTEPPNPCQHPGNMRSSLRVRDTLDTCVSVHMLTFPGRIFEESIHLAYLL
jgi:hypothetical protein